MTTGIKANVSVRLNIRPSKDVMDELNVAVLVALVEWIQLVVREAVKPPPEGSPFDTGKNRRSIGWMISKHGSSTFGTLSTVGSGQHSPGSVRTESAIPIVALATSSGYGGWLEIGTSRMSPRPYLVPAVKKLRSKLDGALSDII